MIISFPGSFNPLHSGHLAMAHWAEDNLEKIVYFDVAKSAYDKDNVEDDDYLTRVQAIKDLGREVYSTNQRSFYLKSKAIFKTFGIGTEIVFLVGMDTAIRIDNPKYYANCIEERNRVLSKYRRTTFYVFPRCQQTYNFSPAFSKIAKMVTDFKELNISSTELRSKETK